MPKEDKRDEVEVVEPPKYCDLSDEEKSVLSQIQWVRLTQLDKKYSGGGDKNPSGQEEITIDVTTKDKAYRTIIHETVKKHFPILTSNFREKDDKKQIVVSYRKSKSNKRGRDGQEWPKDRPKFLHFTLYKQDFDTGHLLGWMGKILHKEKRGFGMAGTKDKRAR